jgi:alpha-beta hydrolase superfamily lysophospholipase
MQEKPAVMKKQFLIIASITAMSLLFAGGCAQHYVYMPSKEMRTNPAELGLTYEDVYFQTSDGVKLNGWYIPAQNARLTVLFCHGNGGNISRYLETAKFLKNWGANVLLFDYRGYGRSEGTPTEEGTYRDARAAWDWLIDKKQIEPNTIVIFGRSLGGSIATELATHVQPAGLWIESTFTSCVDVGAARYPRWIVKIVCRSYKYPTLENIRKVHCPVLVVHSPEDKLVPYKLGQELFAAANEPKTFVEISGSHWSGFRTSGEKYTAPIAKWLNSLQAAHPKSS